MKKVSSVLKWAVMALVGVMLGTTVPGCVEVPVDGSPLVEIKFGCGPGEYISQPVQSGRLTPVPCGNVMISDPGYPGTSNSCDPDTQEWNGSAIRDWRRPPDSAATCTTKQADGTACLYGVQCAGGKCNGTPASGVAGTCGQKPADPSSDMASTTPPTPDMTGIPTCSFELQTICLPGVHCLPKPGQAADGTTECRIEKAVVKATNSTGANNVSVECSDGAGTMNVIVLPTGVWGTCPAPTNVAAKALGNDRLYVAVAGSGQIKSYPAGTSVPLL